MTKQEATELLRTEGGVVEFYDRTLIGFERVSAFLDEDNELVCAHPTDDRGPRVPAPEDSHYFRYQEEDDGLDDELYAEKDDVPDDEVYACA